MVTKSQKRISGPMLDHMDIHIKVPRVDYEKLSSCAKFQHGGGRGVSAAGANWMKPAKVLCAPR
jgi:predicted ATPase with chaperone activity